MRLNLDHVPVQEPGRSDVVLLEEVDEVDVVLDLGAPAADAGEVVARAEREHAHAAALGLKI